MRLHVDLLGWFHVIWGAFGVLAGASLAVLAVGTRLGSGSLGPIGTPERAAVWVLATCAVTLIAFGSANVIVGRALLARKPAGRMAALALTIPNLIVVPFGTALGVYGLWVLLNDDARRQFGRPLRGGPAQPAPAEGG